MTARLHWAQERALGRLPLAGTAAREVLELKGEKLWKCLLYLGLKRPGFQHLMEFNCTLKCTKEFMHVSSLLSPVLED